MDKQTSITNELCLNAFLFALFYAFCQFLCENDSVHAFLPAGICILDVLLRPASTISFRFDTVPSSELASTFSLSFSSEIVMPESSVFEKDRLQIDVIFVDWWCLLTVDLRIAEQSPFPIRWNRNICHLRCIAIFSSCLPDDLVVVEQFLARR